MTVFATASGRRPIRLHTSNLLLMIALAVVCAGFAGGVGYLLWPTWRAGPPADPDRLPITIGSALFNIPAPAIRVKMQRRAGPQERVDLSFAYPSLLPPAPHARVTADQIESLPVANDRLFLTISSTLDVVTPIERARTIYPRYVDGNGRIEDGLTGRAFRETSPYNGEDLFTAEAPPLVARCTRDTLTPGMCLSERRVNGAHLTFRFPREWLSDWREIATAMDTVVETLSGPKR